MAVLPPGQRYRQTDQSGGNQGTKEGGQGGDAAGETGGLETCHQAATGDPAGNDGARQTRKAAEYRCCGGHSLPQAHQYRYHRRCAEQVGDKEKP